MWGWLLNRLIFLAGVGLRPHLLPFCFVLWVPSCPSPVSMLPPMEPSASAAASAAAAAGPRVYVPFTHPDSPVPTYAVLQFLGFSAPPDASHPSLLNPNFPPTMNPSPPQHLKQLTCLSPLSANSHPNPNPIPVTSPSPSPSPSPKGGSPADSSSHSSGDRDRDEKDKKLTSIKPSPMKKPGASSAAGALSPGARRGVKGSMTPSISISHTDRDTIIHTNCSNFREVVHQLTGAGSDDKDLMPVTMPARTINRNGGDNQGNVRQENPNPPMAAITAPKLADLGSARRPATTTTKLLERRKSNKVLERLSTSCRDLPPLVPSPVTPLASDFEKICLPVTPTTSQGSSTAAAAVAVTLSSHEDKAMEVGAEEGKAMDVEPSLPHAMDVGSSLKLAVGMGSTNTAHDEELVIARKGFFLHSQRPRHGDPTLLHLFPESPREH